MRTHEWNALDHRDALILWPELPLLGVLVSVASRDGVYTLDDLRAEVQDSGELPPALRTVAEHLAAGTGVYDLTDLRRELRAAYPDEAAMRGQLRAAVRGEPVAAEAHPAPEPEPLPSPPRPQPQQAPMPSLFDF